MSAVSSGFRSLIKSIQYGSVTAGGTATITAVNLNKAVLNYLGCTNSSATVPSNAVVHLQDATTVSCGGSAASGTITARFCVVEYW